MTLIYEQQSLTRIFEPQSQILTWEDMTLLGLSVGSWFYKATERAASGSVFLCSFPHMAP